MIISEKRYNPIFRDTYKRFILRYNTNYNLYTILKDNLLIKYNPNVFKELLYDDRLVIINELLKNYIVAPLAKRLHLTWV
jgi:hypothetical protein